MKVSKRILVTSSSFPRWENDLYGNFVYELASRLTNNSKVFVLCPHAKGVKKYEKNGNLEIFRYKYLPFDLGSLAYDGSIMPKLKKNKLYYLQVPFFLLFQLFAIRKTIKKNNIEVIHANWIIPQGFMAVLYKKIFNNRIKILATIHGSDIFGLNNKIGIWIKKFVLDNIDELTVVSNAIKNEVSKFGYKKEIYVYPMGIDTDLFRPDKKNPKIKEKLGIKKEFLLFVGRLAENKGLKYLLESMPEVLKKYPLSKLVIVGTGLLKNRLVKLAKELKIDKSVIFAGHVPKKNLPEYFATCDVFLGPSIVLKSGESEGFGLVIAEAMSCGAAVIATDLPAIKDIVEDNETGFIVKQKDSGELSSAIISLLSENNKVTEMKIKAREYVIQHFDWELITKKYERLIREI